MPVFRPYIPFLCSDPHRNAPSLTMGVEALDALARRSLLRPHCPDGCGPYAAALSARFASRFRGDTANAATVLVIVLVEALHADGRLPRGIQLWELRVLVMGIIGRLRCFSPSTAPLVLDVLAQFWRFLSELWAVPALDSVLSYLEDPKTIKALRKRMIRTAREPAPTDLVEEIEATVQTTEGGSKRRAGRKKVKGRTPPRGEAA